MALGAQPRKGACMFNFIVRRFFNLVPVFFGATILVFLIIQASPGNYLDEMRQNPNVKRETIERLERQYGLDQPVYVQYFLWARGVLTGNFGESFKYDRPVTEVIARPVQNSMILAIGNIVLLYALAIPIGVYGAVRQYSLGDKVISVGTYFFLGFPSFFLALITIYLILQMQYAAGRPILPVGGMTSTNFDQLSPMSQLANIAWHALAPIIVVTIREVASFSRFMRGQMLEYMNQDYIRTARAKGLAERVVVYKHALRNAATPFVATIGGILPGLVGGVGFVEVVFNWPGITPMYLEAIASKDIYLITGFIAITLILLIIGNLLSDLLLAVVDPRVRYN
jgi:peptide/nickel transport system permease protein